LISRADEAQMFVVFTRVDRRPGREGIGRVLVERGAPAFRSPALRDLIGKRVLAGLDPVDGILGMGMF
jgi:alkylation response protein AidB-like acyl-CoA dehydrogenase